MRAAAVSALGEVGPTPALLSSDVVLQNRAAVLRVISLLKDRRWRVRYLSTVALGKWGVVGATCAVSGRSMRFSSAAEADDRPVFDGVVGALVGAMQEGLVKHRVAGHALARLGAVGHETLIVLCRGDAVACVATAGGELPVRPHRGARRGQRGGAPHFFTPSSQMRAAAAFGLGTLAPWIAEIDEAVQVLYDAASMDPIPTVRAAALGSLARLSRGAAEQVVFLRIRSLHPQLYHALSDSGELVRLTAAELLAKAGVEGELLLVEAVQRDASAVVRSAAVHGLMRIGARAWRSLLLALGDNEASVRHAAADALLSVGLGALVAVVAAQPRAVGRQELRAALRPTDRARTPKGDVARLLETILQRLFHS